MPGKPKWNVSVPNSSFVCFAFEFNVCPPLLVEDIKGWVAELCTDVQLHCAAIDCTVLDHSAIYCFTAQ